jgi:hypothetical protein
MTFKIPEITEEDINNVIQMRELVTKITKYLVENVDGTTPTFAVISALTVVTLDIAESLDMNQAEYLDAIKHIMKFKNELKNIKHGKPN